ncbi:hypothetical protein ACHAXT_010063 [Thalassiosira profunda]
MLTHPIAAALLLGGSASAAARPQGPPRKLSPRQFQRELYGSSSRASALRKKFLNKATFVGGRQLSADDDAFKSWADAQYQKGSAWYSNYANQADDGGEAEEDEEQQQEYEYGAMQQQYGFNPSSYALSYHRCAAVQQYDDKVAASDNTDDVFATKNFAVFRFCPAATCDAEIVVEEDDQDGGRRRRLEEAAEDADAEQADGEAQEYDFEYPEYGARGRGCNKNYGEYLLTLEDFLQMMTEDQQERLEGYCDFCDEYMYDMYVDQCVNNGNCRKRNLKFEAFKEDRELQRELGFNYGICAEVPYVCHDTLDDSLTEYFECTEAGGMYVGPHCGADGFSVTLGVYADEECNKYVGGDVADYIGQDVDEDDLMKWYNSRHGVLDFLYEGEEESLCISCARKDNVYEQLQYGGDDDANNGDEEEADADEGEISELCQAVYESSARCDRHFRSFSRGDLSQEQWKEMQLSCAFIESIDIGNYDELGYVNLKHYWNFQGENAPEWARDNMQLQEAGQSVADVSPLQIFGLVFAILACIVLASWSKTLHTSLRKGPATEKGVSWAPGRPSRWTFFQRSSAPGVAPSDSGIGATRVRSENSAYYLS